MKRYNDADRILKTISKWAKDDFSKTKQSYANGYKSALEAVQDLIEDEAIEDVKEIPPTGMGDMSDGYHTFNELYHHRAILFSVICKHYRANAWKSKLHHDGTMFDGMFIVGIDTPTGQATYHYDIKPYWDMFDVKELAQAPEWDGHTASEAIERIGGLSPVRGEWLGYVCSVCECSSECGSEYFCPNCGADMRKAV